LTIYTLSIVVVNGIQEFRKRNKLKPGDVIEVEGVEITILIAAAT